MTTQLTPALGIPPHRVGNPHHVDPESDRLFRARHDIPGHVETAFVSCWDDTSHVGLYLHIGRCPQDIELFWAQVLVYLPDGNVAVDRSWGRTRDADTMDTGNLQVQMDNPLRGWRVTFDGAAQLSSPDEMARTIVGAGRARPLAFDIQLEAAGPMWDLYATRRGADGAQDQPNQAWAQGTHTQQAYRHRGSLTFDGIRYALNGFGGNDHSSGPRHLTAIGGDLLLIAGWPDRVLHYTHTFENDGNVVLDVATVFGVDGRHENVTVAMPYLASTLGHPTSFDITLTSGAGQIAIVTAEVQATASVTLTDDNDNLNGVDLGGPNSLILNESRLRLTLPDGTVGAAYLERGQRRSNLPDHSR